MSYTAINLSSLPAPEVVETLDYETILQEHIDEFLRLYPDYTTADLESDMVKGIFEVDALRELNLRQRLNDSAKQGLLAYSTGTNLDHIAALYGVTRGIVDPGDAEAIPPIDPTYETDDDLRQRVQLAPEALTTAGSQGSYIFNALSAGETPTSMTIESPESGVTTVTYTYDPNSNAGQIKDVSASNNGAGQVLVTILGREGDGTVTDALVDDVKAHLNSDYVVPLTDQVTVKSASIVNYGVKAKLTLYDGPDSDLVLDEARAGFEAFVSSRHRLGERVTSSGLHTALQVGGVQFVELTGWEDIICDASQAPYNKDGLTLTWARADG